MAPDSAFEILPVDRSDIPRLAYIHVVCCEMDNCFRLYFSSNAEFLQKVTDMLERQVGDPTWHHAKAVDKATGTLASWASWHTPTDEQIRERDDKADKASKEPPPVPNRSGYQAQDSDNGTGAVGAAVVSTSGMGRGGFDFPPGLSQYIKQDTDKWINAWTHSRRHISVRGLFTDPLFQRRGMGSALVEYGNGLADLTALPVLLQASAYGAPVYSKHGFHTVQHLDVDLREWAPGADIGDKGYGTYRVRYMVRLPKTVTPS